MALQKQHVCNAAELLKYEGNILRPPGAFLQATAAAGHRMRAAVAAFVPADTVFATTGAATCLSTFASASVYCVTVAPCASASAVEETMKRANGLLVITGGGTPSGMDAAKVVEQMKNLMPEEVQVGMSQAERRMVAQKQYMYDAAVMLMNKGDTLVKDKKCTATLSFNTLRHWRISVPTGNDILTLKVRLLNNSSRCYLATKEVNEALKASKEALKYDPKCFKVLLRRGLARAQQGMFVEVVSDVGRAASSPPTDKVISAALVRLRGLLKDRVSRRSPCCR